METLARSYEAVSCDGDDDSDKPGRDWKPFLRQMLVSSGMWTCYFTYGMFLGTPTVLVPYVRREANSTEAVSKNMASCKTVKQVLISEILQGPIVASNLTVGLLVITEYTSPKYRGLFLTFKSASFFWGIWVANAIGTFFSLEKYWDCISCVDVVQYHNVLTEYTSPKYRGLFLTIKSATFFWGIWVANAIGTFLHWKNVGVVGLLCMAYNLITICFWCESPYWLVKQGRFDECAQILYWLKGADHQSQDELKNLIKAQKERLRRPKNNENQVKKYHIH
ncbi:facilitated trehalose transporter Tret1-like [Amyelois transitella]|uniref:facilitated trehalose transporter Tret1-like n=1 Tax=Amyelois transitella TaxID=680683 RepID=UPI00298FD48F|nr:facilitated trehalose transporter Tret1-like [Amyelois transitella]